MVPQLSHYGGGYEIAATCAESSHQRMHPSSPSGNNERRKHLRMALRLPGHIVRRSDARGVERISMVTRDISVGGFFAFCEEEFSQGQLLSCVLEVCAGEQPAPSSLRLQCTARVIRAERTTGGPGPFGIGLQIESYDVAREVSD